MGPVYGTTREPATTREITRSTSVEPANCSLCFNRYQRIRQSVCTCSHCSLPLCTDCLHSHINELPQNIAQLSQQLHELEQVFQSKQNMVNEEISNSTAEVSKCVKTYQNELIDTHQVIISDLEKAKYDAKEHLNKIASELHAINIDIATLAEETVFQPKRIEALFTQLNQIQEKLQTYGMIKDVELRIVLPKYTLKFQCIPNSTTNTNELSESETSNVRDSTGNRSSRRHTYHPYRKAPVTVSKKNVLPSNDETDGN